MKRKQGSPPVKYEGGSQRKLNSRRRKMTSPRVRHIEVSTSLIKSWIETGLRQMKEITDDEGNVQLTIGLEVVGKLIPIEIKTEEEVSVIKY